MRHSKTELPKTTIRPWQIYPFSRMDLIIFGTGSNAEMAWDYFLNETDYNLCGFTVEERLLTKPTYKNYQLVPFETVENLFPPDRYLMFVAIGNCRFRQEIYQKCKEKGYKFANFISNHAKIGRNVNIGENCMIQEFNNLQYGVEIGDNTWLWANNHIGHHTKIGKHCFLASGITVSGYCEIGDNVFIGSGVTTADNIQIESEVFLKVGTVVKGNINGRS